MANFLYGKARQRFLEGGMNWTADNVKVVLIDTADYTAQQDVHEFLSDIPAPARVATSGNLQNKTSTLGVADADDISIPAVTGDTVEAAVFYKDTGNPATSPLIAYLDAFTVNMGPPPYTPNGGAVTCTWDNGANRIFKL